MLNRSLRQVIAQLSLLSGSLLLSTAAAAPLPPDLGPTEIRCRDGSCQLGTCAARDLVAQPDTALSGVRISPVMENGQVTGWRLLSVKPGSLPERLGIQNGDILQTVNGLAVGDPTAALAAYDKLRGADSFQIKLLRAGQPLTRTVELDRRPPPAAAPCPAPAPRPVPPASPARPTPQQLDAQLSAIGKDIACKGNRCVLKNGVVERILASTELLLSSGRIVPDVRDGKVQGLRMFGIRPASLWARLGLRNGDLVRTVGGMEISSPESALSSYAAVRSADTVPVELVRDGKPLTIVYAIERAADSATVRP